MKAAEATGSFFSSLYQIEMSSEAEGAAWRLLEVRSSTTLMMHAAPSHWNNPKGIFNQKTVVKQAANGSMLPNKLASFGISDSRLLM